MPNDVYNLGRSSGLSAWEIYVRQSLLLNPEIEPLSEREWLSETIGIGTSMLLKITAGTRDVHDYPLPANSTLCAPNTIIGSFFYGEGGGADDAGWCKKVTDYGVGISNTSDRNMGNGSVNALRIPKKQDVSLDDTTKNRMMQYIKIQDAIVLQTGTWSDSGTTSPAKTFVPNIAADSGTVLRITFDEQINTDFYILLTGFVTRAIVKGEVGFDMGSVIPDDASEASAYHPENGDFLGPELYPWANKVIFTYPQILTKILRDGIRSQSDYIKVQQNSADQTQTDIYASKLEAGVGVKLTESTDSTNQNLPKILIASQVQSENSYLQVQQTSGITKLTPASPQAGLGVQITPPASNGGNYTIASPITSGQHSASYPKGPQYLHVKQNGGSTELCPSYPNPGKGVQITDPSSPGQAYDINAEIKSSGDAADYLQVTQREGQATELSPSELIPGVGIQIEGPDSAGGKINLSAQMEVGGNSESSAKYLKVDQAANGTTTIQASPITAEDGIGLTQPSSPGAEIKISSKIQSSNNYIHVTQSATSASGTPTTLQASTIKTQDYTQGSTSYPSRLVLQQPTTPGGDIVIGTKINYQPHLGVAIYDDSDNGIAHIGSPIGVAGTARSAKAIKITQSSGLRTDVNFPTNVIISENDSPAAAIEAITDQVTNILQLSEMVVDEKLLKDYVYKTIIDDSGEEIKFKYDNDVLKITYPDNPGGDIVFFIDIDEIIKRMKNEFATKDYVDDQFNKLKNYVNRLFNDLLKKIYVGGDSIAIKLENGSDVPIDNLADFITKSNADIAADLGETIDDNFGQITWPTLVQPDTIKIPMGNLNIYSNDQSGNVFEHSLRSRDGNSQNDIRLK